MTELENEFWLWVSKNSPRDKTIEISDALAWAERKFTGDLKKDRPKKSGYVLGDYDFWYKPCVNCGHDEAKSVKPKTGNKRCWKCGRTISRDYSERALKPGRKHE